MGSTMHVLLALIGYWVFSAAVGAMIEPSEEQKRGWYGWLFRFAQILAANADRLAAAKFGPALVGGSGTEKHDHNAADLRAATDPEHELGAGGDDLNAAIENDFGSPGVQ